jgi:hypothetical protein
LVRPNAIGSSLKVRATDANNATVTDMSDNPFTVKGKLLLMSPNGGEEWIVSSIRGYMAADRYDRERQTRVFHGQTVLPIRTP